MCVCGGIFLCVIIRNHNKEAMDLRGNEDRVWEGFERRGNDITML